MTPADAAAALRRARADSKTEILSGVPQPLSERIVFCAADVLQWDTDKRAFMGTQIKVLCCGGVCSLCVQGLLTLVVVVWGDRMILWLHVPVVRRLGSAAVAPLAAA